MDRHTLLGLSATLSIAQAMLDQAGLRNAGTLLNAAVVEIRRAVRWSDDELREMGRVQFWIVESIRCFSVAAE